jgi:hypothetical protein
MKTNLSLIHALLLTLVLCGLILANTTAHAQGTAFTYQGQLQSSGAPANGLYDFVFSLSNAPSGGSQVGGSVTSLAVGVTNGLFTTTLNFGAVFAGNATWLAISVRTNGTGSYAGLTPLQPLTPTPYALFASTASNVSGTVSAGQLSGTVPLAQLPGTVVTNNQTGVTFANMTVGNNLYLPATTFSSGIIYAGGSPYVFANGSGNFFAGTIAGNLSMSGNFNTGVGYQALYANNGGTFNTAVGELAMYNNGSGANNAAFGAKTLGNNLSGAYNVADGVYALWFNSSGSYNTAIGYQALYQNQSAASYNIALGALAGYNILNGSSNIDIGNQGMATDTNILRLGSGQTQAFIAGVITGNGGGLTNLNTTNFSGTIPLAQLPAAVVTNNASGLTLTGTFTGNGAGLTNLNAAALNGSLWQMGGNNVSPGQFLGSTNNQPVEFWVNGQRALRLEPGGPSAVLQNGVSTGAPNVIGGSPANFVAPGVVGAVIGGGGATNYWNGSGRTNSIGTFSDFCTISGGGGNSIQNYANMSVIGGGGGNSMNGTASVIGGGFANTVQENGLYAVIGGGLRNTAGAEATVGGGVGNVASGAGAFIGGGGSDGGLVSGNLASGPASVISGGGGNSASGGYATVAGGEANNATGIFATVGGGNNNTNNGNAGTISGGQNNTVTNGYQPAVGGGYGNTAGASYATVSGGINNTASGSTYGASVVGGGQFNFAVGDLATVGGGYNNVAGGSGAFIGGGGYDGLTAFGNKASGAASVVSGGLGNVASGAGAFIGGGGSDGSNPYGNTASGAASVVGGGLGNVASGPGAFIGGGGYAAPGNTASGMASVIGGGADNQATNSYSVVGGGYGNTAGGAQAFVGDGYGNVANGQDSFIGGGNSSTASGLNSFIGGGNGNTASGSYSTVSGGAFNVAGGQYSFAAGRQAQALNQGAFVWADSQNAVFASTANDQFLIRAQGGVGINTDSTPDSNFCINTNTYLFSHAIYLRGDTGTDHNHGLAYCGPGATNFAANVLPDGPVLWGYSGGALGVMSGGAKAVLTWTNTGVYVNGGFAYSSDRNLKSGFAALNPLAVLACVASLPVTSWAYTNNATARHIGPMAQDFHAAFKVNGDDDTHINVGDETGVALAAIQGLNQKVEEKDAKIKELEARLEKLEQMMSQKHGGGR